MKPHAKCSRCERSEPATVITIPFVLPPEGWGEVILRVTGHGELAREFVFCDRCRAEVLVGIDRLALRSDGADVERVSPKGKS